MELLNHSAVAMTSVIERPRTLAAKVAADQVEWAVNTFVSTPSCWRT